MMEYSFSCNKIQMEKAEIKNAMEQYFEKPEIMEKIQIYLTDRNLTYEELDNDALVNILDELELLDPIISKIDSELPTDVSFNKKSLRFTIQSARSFGGMQKYAGSKFVISLCFLNQRFQSRPIKCGIQPKVFEAFQMKIDKASLKLEELRNIQLSVVITQDQNKIIYAIKEIDWRFVLAFGSITFDIELASHKDPNISAGILNLKLDLYPKGKNQLISQRLLNNQFQLEKKTKQKTNSQFYEYTTQFWNDYKSIHPTFAKRSVPIYRQSQDRIYIHVCKYICPLYNIRGIDSPFHALRFVSLIPYEEESINTKSLCKRFHSLLAAGKGSIIDHCHLLCSLLLGFGMNAYVCTGYSTKGEHSWVMTFFKKENIVWEPLNGLRFALDSDKGKFYKLVNTIYNHEQFYANIQMNQMIGAITFDLKNETKWKPIPQQKIQKLFPFNHQISFLHPTINIYSLEEEIQERLMQEITSYRKEYKLDTRIDHKLCSILSIALANYEYERITEQTFGEKQFQEAIRSYIPEKHTFKAFPIQLQQTNIQKILNILKANRMSNQILLTRGDSVYLALKTKVVVYPDNYTVVWLSLASRYYKLL